MTELAFLQKFYGSLAFMVLAFWGLGQSLLDILKAERPGDRWLSNALAIAVGLGVFTLALQGLAITAQLKRPFLLALLILGWCLAAGQAWRAWQGRRLTEERSRVVTWHALDLLSLALVLTVGVPTLVAPLTPPMQWDELMYHLPHAKQWAQSGALTINEWLRYPWFPYNYDLLYAAALILKGDILAHLLHALAGWLVALMLYRQGLRHGGRAVACLATSAWLVMGGHLYASAYIDLGMALFVMSSFVSMWLWWQQRAQQGWLLVAAFFLGLAAGSKYQALTYLPFFVMVLLWLEPRAWKTWTAAAAAFLLPCAYWYLRNYIETGDPFDPLGARIFGFHDWNEWDLNAQLADLKRVANWPPKALWPALLTLVMPRFYSDPDRRGVLLFGAYGSLVWLATSHYDRYLLPMYPVLGLLSAQVIVDVTGWALRHRPRLVLEPAWVRQQLGLLFALGLLLAVGGHSWRTSRDYLRGVAFTPEQRELVLTQVFPVYPMLQHLHLLEDRRIYQIGLENLIYYAPAPIWGEVFGPWRYSERLQIGMQVGAQALAQRLSNDGFNTLLARDDVLLDFRHDPEFERYFRSVEKGAGAEAFEVLP